MPVTLAELTYNIKNLVRGGQQSDDEPLSDRQVEFIINYVRAMLIRRDLDKGRTINPDLIQDLGCVDVGLADEADCCGLTLPTGCYVLKTDLAIPRTVELTDRNLLTFIGSIDKKYSFPLVPAHRARWTSYNKYTSKVRRSYLLNEHIFITNDEMLAKVSIRGVFEDPREASRFSACSGDPCWSPSDPYPIAAHMIQPLTEIVLSKEMRIGAVAPTDTTNDASQEIAQNVRQDKR